MRQYLARSAEGLTLTQTIPIVIDIATALAELDGKVVHRDLKPENVLFLEEVWCLSDFGISRYAEATTAPDTRKFALSAPYAAPERWRTERAGSAADIYSLGVMMFEMLSGKLPFPGPTMEDFREQHLHGDAPALLAGNAATKAIVTEALFKAPGARPSPANLLARIRQSQQKRSGGLAQLSEAHLGEVAKLSEKARLEAAARSAAEQRAELFKGAASLLKGIYDSLVEAIVEAAPSTKKGASGKRKGLTLSLGSAELELVPIGATAENQWEGDAPAFDVVAHAGIILRIPPDRYQFAGRSHSLWYCDAFDRGRYEWVEIAFMMSPMISKTTTMRPFMADPGVEAARALSIAMTEFELGWPMEPVDADALVDRWAHWLADAAQGHLLAPSMMPERPTPRVWRQK